MNKSISLSVFAFLLTRSIFWEPLPTPSLWTCGYINGRMNIAIQDKDNLSYEV